VRWGKVEKGQLSDVVGVCIEATMPAMQAQAMTTAGPWLQSWAER